MMQLRELRTCFDAWISCLAERVNDFETVQFCI
jgi:hypothetical protein